MEWQVDYVDRTEDAGADVKLGKAVVRIHRRWFLEIHDDGLCHVARHYPLAIEPITFCELPDDIQLKLCRRRIDLWRAVAIEQEFVRGLFAGRLRVDQCGNFTYIARTHDRRGASAHWDIMIAVREALKERRRKLKKAREDDKRLAEFRTEISGRLQARLARGRFQYIEVPLNQFCQRVTSRVSEALQFRFCHAATTVLLIELERWAVDAVQILSAHDIRSLIRQLDIAIDEAQLTLHDEYALRQLARLR